MKPLNLLDKFQGYFSAQATPETIAFADRAYFISIQTTGSFTDQAFFGQLNTLKKAAHKLKENFDNTDKAFEVSVLEALYWYDEDKYGFVAVPDIFSRLPLDKLDYRLMIRIPDYITEKDITVAVNSIEIDHTLAVTIELFERTEGQSVQMLHLGPFPEEGKTLLQIQQYMDNKDLIKAGVHHEIYLVDFTEEQDENNLKTILREQVKNKYIPLG